METESSTLTGDPRYDEYRAVCASAIMAAIIGVLSLLAVAFVPMLVISGIGLTIGVYAILKIRRRPDELTGLVPAKFGAFLSAVTLFGGTAWHSYVYATEVPDGYSRISFHELQPESDNSKLAVSKRALEMNEKKVFVKGYVYPDERRTKIKQFVLVPDMGSCCFGGQPKLTDMIQVTLRDPQRINFSYRRRKLGGVLRVDTQLKPVSGVNGVYYQLDADYVK